MATDTGFRFADLKGDEDPRAQFFAKLDALRTPAMEAAKEAMSLLRLLPDALARSQGMELERLKRSAPEDPSRSARVRALEQEIADTATLREMAAHGNARVDRWFEAMDDTQVRFHGFVSHRDLSPLAKARVEISTSSMREPLRTKTDADGYFSVVIADGTTKQPDAAAARAKVDAKNARAKAAAAKAEAAVGPEAEVAIYLGDALLFRDPEPLPLAQGAVYREYIVGDGDGDASRKPARAAPAEPPAAPRGGARKASTARPKTSTPRGKRGRPG
jgi:hypothetical protein